MTLTQESKQSADYRAAASSYAASGDAFVAEMLTELADRIDAIILASRYSRGQHNTLPDTSNPK